jgi:hypothetical protein
MKVFQIIKSLGNDKYVYHFGVSVNDGQSYRFRTPSGEFITEFGHKKLDYRYGKVYGY